MRLRARKCSRLRAWMMLSTLALPVGCSSIDKNHDSEFLKPLGSSLSAQSTREPMPSERLLCLETAKTVARQGHTAEAIKLYERAEQLAPTAAPVDAKLAPLYADVGNSDAAIERYKRCLLRSPNDIELANNFAWTLMEAGRFDQAISEIGQALQAEPDNVRLRSTLAVIHYRQGDHAGALRHFEKAYGSDAAHHNLAILDIDTGNFESAKTHLQIAKQSNKLDTKTQSLASVFESKGSIR